MTKQDCSMIFSCACLAEFGAGCGSFHLVVHCPAFQHQGRFINRTNLTNAKLSLSPNYSFLLQHSRTVSVGFRGFRADRHPAHIRFIILDSNPIVETYV